MFLEPRGRVSCPRNAPQALISLDELGRALDVEDAQARQVELLRVLAHLETDRSLNSARSCPTDAAAKELPWRGAKRIPAHCRNTVKFGDQAKNWKAEEEELL
ncbi:hypothetical protein B0H13DRAFT_1876626 [Mycena leptocephala]|nr:hypothetical protein B0H13DRAFT_1876626 [Mycena leptocephala]